MISVSGAAGVGYYAGGSGPGAAESYYLGATAHGEPPGRWSGRLAADLGLSGDVTVEAMEPLYQKFEAPNGTRLGRAPGQYRGVEERLAQALEAEPDALPERVDELRRGIQASAQEACLAEDLTFSPPKSVTVAHTAAWRAEVEARRTGDDARAEAHRATREAIEGAVWRANEAAMEYASSVMTARAGTHGRGKAGHWVEAPDTVIASFHQHTTRANKGDDRASIDPQQHIHNVILNRVRCIDGEIRAIDTRDLGGQRAGISAVADRVLAEEMARAGMPMDMRPDGVAREVRGVSDDEMELFSSRRRNISSRLGPLVTAAEERYGRPLTDLEVSRMTRNVTLFTRAAKSDTDGDFGRLLDEWQDRMREELGRGLVPLAERLRVAAEAARQAPEQESVTFSPEVVKGLAVHAVQEAARKSGTWNRADLMLEVERVLPVMPGLTPEQSVGLLNRLTDQALAEHGVQVSGCDTLPALGEARPGLGYVRPSAMRYAAPETLQGEQRIREAALERGRFAVDREAVAERLTERFPSIGADQRAAVEGIASSDAALSVLVGPAGTGKSFATGALADAWGALSGGRVQGLTVSQIAAEVLKDDGVDAANISAWLAAQERVAAGRPIEGDLQRTVGPRDILVVDEASMVGTGDLNRIRDLADAAGARVVLTGDPHQLGAVDAGGVMDLLDGRAETYTLTDVRRFAAPWEAEASLALRQGDVEALAEYDRHGRFVEHDSMGAAIEAAARAAAADILAGHETLVVAGTNEQAAAISAAIRDHLLAAGVVQESGALLGRDQNLVGAGDRIMTRQNDYDLGVVNRGRFEVVEPLPDGGLRVVDSDGVEKVLPAEYVEQHVQLAYAGTVHAAQGVTVDRSHYVTDGRTDPSSLYVGLTRGQERNTAHVATGGRDVGLESGTIEVTGRGAPRTAESVLRGAVEQERAVPSATVAHEQDEARGRSMDYLIGRKEAAVEVACRERLERHLDELQVEGLLSAEDRARLCADQATMNLSRVMRAVEQTGADPKDALRQAMEGRDLSNADSVAQVLMHRIEAVHDLAEAAPSQVRPADIGAQHEQHIAAIDDRIEDRIRDLGSELSRTPPGWAQRSLGPVPEDAVQRLEWESRAGIVAAHREATGWTDDRRPIDHAPGLTWTERRASYWSAWEALGRPEATREEAGLSDARLQSRVAAWEREKVWAPPHADNSLKAAELDAEKARQEAVLAWSRGDMEAAQQLDTEAERREAVARGMADVAQGRSAWAESTAQTRTAAERASEELTSRGLEPGRELDRVTPEEWLEADRLARERDEPHREITDLDVEQVSERDREEAAEVEAESRDRVRATALEQDEPEPVQEDTGRTAGPHDQDLHTVEGDVESAHPSHERAPLEPSQVELDAMVQQAAEAENEVLDRESQEAAYQWEQEAPVVEDAEPVLEAVQ